MWYYFAITGGVANETIHCRITDMNSVAKVYNQDLRPLVRVPALSKSWERYPTTHKEARNHQPPVCSPKLLWRPRPHPPPPFTSARLEGGSTYSVSEQVLQIDFTYTFLSSSPVFFAFYYPFPYDDAVRLLDVLEKKYSGRSRARVSPHLDRETVYFCRELLTHSVQGRRVDLLTVTSFQGHVHKYHVPTFCRRRLSHVEGFPTRLTHAACV